jgi:hypothetical protein
MRAMRSASAAHVDFGDFEGMIESNPKLLPSDIDMIIERKGKFFVGEWKRQGENISQGQAILLQTLAKQSQFTVCVVIGNTDTETVIHSVLCISKSGEYRKIGASLDDLKVFINQWYEWADNG